MTGNFYVPVNTKLLNRKNSRRLKEKKRTKARKERESYESHIFVFSLLVFRSSENAGPALVCDIIPRFYGRNSAAFIIFGER